MEKIPHIGIFMHVPFEGPGVIADWIASKAYQSTYTRFYEQEPLPDISRTDMLIIMGGPMNVFDYHIHPWMQEEIEWVEGFIQSGKPVLGICLGAQILATALDVEVYPGKYKEIGWHRLQFLPALGDFKISRDLPASRKVFHWHGDTFPIPDGAVRIASSAAFPNQGFIYNRRVIALQFHLEVDKASVRALVDHCADQLVEGPHVQSRNEILAEQAHFKENQELMYRFLDYLSAFIS